MLRLYGAALGTDNAHRHGRSARQRERVSDCHHPVPYTQAPRIGKLHGREVLSVDLEDRKVRQPVYPHHGGVERIDIRNVDLDVSCVIYHVQVGHDVAVGTHDYAGGSALVEIAKEEALLHRLDGDGNDGWPD